MRWVSAECLCSGGTLSRSIRAKQEPSHPPKHGANGVPFLLDMIIKSQAKDEDDDQSQTKMDVVTEESAPAAVQLADATAFDGLLSKGFEARLVRPATWPGLMRELLPRLAIFRDILDMAGKPSVSFCGS